ncbi:MAG TPA: hypothetical protein PK765_07695 [bacterium]|nr:hypothetical protein [bacterium]
MKETDEQILLKLIVLLCISPKNREVDNCICANRMRFTDKDSSFFQTFDRPIMFLNAPTFSKEIKAKAEDVMNFLGTTNENTPLKPAEIREYYKRYNRTLEQKIGGFLATIKDPVVLTIMTRYARIAFFYKELLAGKDGTLLYYTFFYLASRHANRLRTTSEEEVEKTQTRIDTLYDAIDLAKYDFLQPRPFPDYAYDKHTAE